MALSDAPAWLAALIVLGVLGCSVDLENEDRILSCGSDSDCRGARVCVFKPGEASGFCADPSEDTSPEVEADAAAPDTPSLDLRADTTPDLDSATPDLLPDQVKADTSTSTDLTVEDGVDAEAVSDAPDVGPIAVSADIAVDTVWESPNTYLLTEVVFVRDNATLTIQAGVSILVEGDAGLVVTRGSKLDAIGSESEPITFSSADSSSAWWQGIHLLGSASVNSPSNNADLERIEPPATESPTLDDFGGSDDAHDCGALQYVRISGGMLTLGGCGYRTVVDHVQVRSSTLYVGGGTVALRHVIQLGLEYDLGWRGSAQFILVEFFGILGTNNEQEPAVTPMSAPVFYNFTIGDRSIGALRFVDGASGTFRNGWSLAFGGIQVLLEGEYAVLNYMSGNLLIEHTAFFFATLRTAEKAYLRGCWAHLEHTTCAEPCGADADPTACRAACRASIEGNVNYSQYFSSLTQAERDAFFAEGYAGPLPNCQAISDFDAEQALSSANGNLLNQSLFPEGEFPGGFYAPAGTDLDFGGVAPPAADAFGVPFDQLATFMGAIRPAQPDNWASGWTLTN